MQKSDFSKWDLDKLDATFGLQAVSTHPVLDQWVISPYTLDALEQTVLRNLQQALLLGGDSWNEFELENKFISPLIMLVNFDNRQFAYFVERELRGIVGDYDFAGRVDGMIASGFRNPHQPYFCLSEYKKQRDPEGDPAAQALVAMLVAYHLNEQRQPMYGSYVVGRDWFFMTLVGQQYCISNSYTATKDEIFDIFRILQGLKQIITRQVQARNI
jgi:hypothetical protein